VFVILYYITLGYMFRPIVYSSQTTGIHGKTISTGIFILDQN